MKPSSFSRDRNVLFGVLALQAGVITESQLVNVMEAWNLNRSVEVSDLLMKQAGLTEEQVDQVRRMVEAGVALNDKDPAKVLSSLSSFNAERSIQDTLKSLSDQVDISSIPTLRKESDAANADTEQVARFQPTANPRFEIVRPYAKGGLGEVFVARDVELNREVALKEIQGQFASEPQSQSRFVLEAEVTGRLEHPGIVPVYGLGTYPDGRPYYAMRLIQGCSFKEESQSFWKSQMDASERLVGLRKLLGRFVDVCQAIGYAHSRGILHRDIKPSNIMLGKYGETLVVDWGLAKVIGRKDSVRQSSTEVTLHPTSGSTVNPTVIGRAIGTPAFMPPEQAAGDLENLGPQSDIYSLGATLYFVLTGDPPFEGHETDRVLKQVTDGSFAPPNSRNPKIPRPLSAICTKAMSLRPEDRYQSASDLSDDLERFLADEPVTAMPEPVTRRVRRWIRKHPTTSTAAVAVVFFTSILLVIVSALVAGNNSALAALNAKLDQANEQLETSNRGLRDAIAEEERLRALAESTEKIARKQTDLAFRTLRDVIFNVQNQIDGFPHAAAIRSRVLTASLSKLDEVAKSFGSSSSADRSMAVAFNALGRLVLENKDADLTGLPMEQRFLAANQSKARTAGRLFQTSLEIFERIANSNPADLLAKRDVAVAKGQIALLKIEQGDLEMAENMLLASQEVFSKVAESKLGNLEFQRDVAIGHQKLAEVSMWRNDSAAAIHHAEQSVAIMRKLAAARPDERAWKKDVAEAQIVLGTIQLGAGNSVEAEKLFKKLLDSGGDLNFTAYKSSLARITATSKLADAYFQSGRLPDAERTYRSALTAVKMLKKFNPGKMEVDQIVMQSHVGLGKCLEAKNDLEGAAESFAIGLEVAESLLDSRQGKQDAMLAMASALENVGRLRQKQGDLAEAAAKFEQSLAIRLDVRLEFSNNTAVLSDLALSFEQLGDSNARNKNSTQAERQFENALKVRNRLVQLRSENRDEGLAIARLHNKIGDVRLASQDFEAAVDRANKAFDRLESSIVVNADDYGLQVESELARCRWALLLALSGKHDKAIEVYRNSIKRGSTLLSSYPNQSSPHLILAKAYIGIADSLIKQQKTSESFEAFESGIAAMEKHTELSPDDRSSLFEYGHALGNYGSALQKMEKYDEALEKYDSSIAIFNRLAQDENFGPSAKMTLGNVSRAVEYIKRLPLIRGDLSTLLQQNPDELPLLLVNRCSYFLGENDLESTTEAAEKLVQLETTNADDLYRAAVVFCLCIEKYVDGQSSTKDRKNEIGPVEKWRALAISALEKSVQKGWNEFDVMANEPRFKPIRQNAKFQAWIDPKN